VSISGYSQNFAEAWRKYDHTLARWHFQIRIYIDRQYYAIEDWTSISCCFSIILPSSLLQYGYPVPSNGIDPRICGHWGESKEEFGLKQWSWNMVQMNGSTAEVIIFRPSGRSCNAHRNDFNDNPERHFMALYAIYEIAIRCIPMPMMRHLHSNWAFSCVAMAQFTVSTKDRTYQKWKSRSRSFNEEELERLW